ncbi:2OG-Fe(II) oxygenase [Thalassospira alkalitolerans]|uniref:2OG-Fe(II) oxygenase n=1 Tax=Thalassospira alkalitolerans TaxID=1293890 RepID=UPI003AA8B639|tara:strand:+ start:14566 stop:15120 length:555 start_codon:yes stop_codon:yes gene_type:complete
MFPEQMYTIVPGALDGATCDRLIDSFGDELDDGGLVQGQSASHIRRSKITWFNESQEPVVTRCITDMVAEANRNVFDFSLSEFAEDAQIACYSGDQRGHYDWHSDVGASDIARRRKLTLVIQLSEPDQYEGGLLQLNPGGHIIDAPMERGTAILFPSFVLHRVAPTTAGLRYSLTQWVHGTPFR